MLLSSFTPGYLLTQVRRFPASPPQVPCTRTRSLEMRPRTRQRPPANMLSLRTAPAASFC
jgi:hypothetical protein